MRLILENIRSLSNVGSIFRSCDGAGIEKLYLAGFTPMPPRKMISKTALWAESSVVWEYHENIATLLHELKNDDWTIMSAEKHETSIDIREMPLSKKTVIILWNEVNGVSSEGMNLSDHLVHLPMNGEKTSLNVSIAASVFAYLPLFISK